MPPGWVVKRGLKRKVVMALREDGVMMKVVVAEEGQRSDQVLYKDRRGQEPLLSMGVIASVVFGFDGVSDAVVIATGLCFLLHRLVASREICTLRREQGLLSWRMTGRKNMAVAGPMGTSMMTGWPWE